MSWIIILTVLAVLITVTEKSNARPFARVRGSRVYQGGRRRTIDVGRAAWGRGGRRQPIKGWGDPPAALKPEPPKRDRRRNAPISYDPPPSSPVADSPASVNGSAVAGSAATVDFFQGMLALVNASYEGPNDALRQLKALAEAARQWNLGLIRIHQRMADRGDMRIDPWVSDHVVRGAALGQAMVLELVEADAAMTALLNMSLSELQERGLWIPNTK